MSLLDATQVLANFGGVISAIGVVISLIYLSVQIRDNSRLVEENTRAQLMTTDMHSNDGNRDLMLEIVKDAELAKLIGSGMNGELKEPIDRYRFYEWARHVTESHMTFFIQQQRGIVTNDVFQYWSRSFDGICARPGYVAVYRRLRDRLPPSFQTYMDAKIAPDTPATSETSG